MEALQEFTASLPPLVQWLGVMLVAAIPFVESYFGSVIGVLAGVPPMVAIIAAIFGNIISMLVFVFITAGVRAKVVAGKEAPAPSPRKQRLRRAFDRWGVPGVSLLGQWFLPSQFTATAMISFGAPRNWVILWQSISIALWGIAFGVLAALGLMLLG